MSINDPKKFDRKIVTPGEAAHQAALGLQQDPTSEELKRVKGDVLRMMQQSKATAIRLNAVMDYLGYIGLFLTQEIDESGFPAGPTSTPLDSVNHLFEGLIDAGIINHMPAYSFDAFFIEHQKISDVLIMLNQARLTGTAKMSEVIDAARSFNEEPKRITKLRGEQIGLVEYLNDNPDKLPEEEVVALGAEFQLNINFKEEEEEEDGGADQAGEDTETEEVPSGADA